MTRAGFLRTGNRLPHFKHAANRWGISRHRCGQIASPMSDVVVRSDTSTVWDNDHCGSRDRQREQAVHRVSVQQVFP